MASSTEIRFESKLGLLVLGHLGVLILIATWGFGGNAPWSRAALCWWGSVGAALTLIAFTTTSFRTEKRLARWLWPFALFNAAVLTSVLHPTLREIFIDHQPLLLPLTRSPLLPSSALPKVALNALWLFDGIYLSCFNLPLVIRLRRSLRSLLIFAAINATVLAVFGSFQRLGHATGLYFGLVPSPQPSFFASFIYQNHWGAYAVLMTAVCLGLVAVMIREHRYRDFFHSPGPVSLLAVFLLALSIPLSSSRSCTVLVLMLLGGVLLRVLFRSRGRSGDGAATMPLTPLARGVVLSVALLALLAGFYIARPILEQRIAKTTEQIAEMREHGDFGSRQLLYGDTWRMARDRLPFGWGMGSYPLIFFYRYNTQDSPVDRLPVFYADAHSDWLQSLAEVGLVGTILLGLHGVVPLLTLRRSRPIGTLPQFLFVGCALILAYAWVEFPFGNPAVVITWWLCFFCALQLARLDHRLRPARP